MRAAGIARPSGFDSASMAGGAKAQGGSGKPAPALEAHAIAREERRVLEALGEKRMHERQHHRGVGIGPDRNPLRADRRRAVVADRTDIDDLDAGARERLHPAADRMLAAAALRD